MNVLALTKYGDLAASTRQRFLQYRPGLARAGIKLEIAPLLDNDYLSRVLIGRKASPVSIAKAYFRRLRSIASAHTADLVWLHCEFLPFWPAFAETLSARAVKRPIVFDFDDAIFHMYDDNGSAFTRLLLKNKLDGLLETVSACTCGNSYLSTYAARYCSRTIIIPTVVDTDSYSPAPAVRAPLTIGWIGSPTTWAGVRPILPVIRQVVAENAARFLVVGAGRAAEADLFAGMELKDWSEASEIADVQAMDIGIMPVLDRPFERGKSGYKLIQYMACGLPVIASPVGVNSDIVSSANGLLASTAEEWRVSLQRLIGDRRLRERMGRAGRKLAEESFSLASQQPRIIELFRSLTAS